MCILYGHCHTALESYIPPLIRQITKLGEREREREVCLYIKVELKQGFGNSRSALYFDLAATYL